MGLETGAAASSFADQSSWPSQCRRRGGIALRASSGRHCGKSCQSRPDLQMQPTGSRSTLLGSLDARPSTPPFPSPLPIHVSASWALIILSGTYLDILHSCRDSWAHVGPTWAPTTNSGTRTENAGACPTSCDLNPYVLSRHETDPAVPAPGSVPVAQSVYRSPKGVAPSP